ncbi:MAG: hypothetical protein KC591_17565, partial [Gemmatimonadetes bacterium]|nr:hypothetical protein [Gemmatimonadota bacterium]
AEWCDHVTEEVDKGGREEAKMLARLAKDHALFAYGWVVKARKHRNLSRIQGVIGEDTPGTKFHHGMPLRAAPTRGGLTDSIGLTKDYSGKWVTGDYDLYDIMWAGSDCERLDQNETSFRTVQELLNGKMGWHGIQHGPQVQWCPRKANHDVSDAEDFPPAVKGILAGVKAGNPDFSKKIDVGGRGIPVMGGEIIAVYPGGTKSLDNPEDVANALLCKGCGE